MLDGSDGRDTTLLADRQNDDARKDFILDAMKRGDLHANVAETELEGRLTDLYRASRLAFEEGGANILYLCLGFLKWTPQDGAGPYRAPLILIPVQLERKSVRSGFRLALHEDEALFNPTLMQMLKQDFDLSMPDSTSNCRRTLPASTLRASGRPSAGTSRASRAGRSPSRSRSRPCPSQNT